ncbi:MAG: tRNA (guanosine(37)-N1)-methyltransferase TrmD [Anaerolineae bacterium]
MLIDILSLFPEYFRGPFDVSIVKRAIEKGLLEIRQTDIRDFAEGRHRKVDDRPFGGGPGMVLMPQPLTKAIHARKETDSHVICLSPQGKVLTAEIAQRLAKKRHLILICGHYEGVDERVLEKDVHEEISIGDYVLTSGCIAAVVLVETVIRFIEGVLGHEDSALKDSFQGGIFDAPQYTRPEVFEGLAVPSILTKGNHAEIEKWRKEQALKKTKRVRPDLYYFYLDRTHKLNS